jgi:parallel beta-helix repeat protein
MGGPFPGPASAQGTRATPVSHRMVDVAGFASDRSPTGGIQEAIDSLPPGGGVVTIPPGEYLLRQSVHVPTHVTLQGAGGSTVLRRANHAECNLLAPTKPGDTSVRVGDANLFRGGDEVGVLDQESFGWNMAHAVVKEVRGDELVLDRRVTRVFDPAKGGIVLTCFPAITANEVSRIVVEGLAIDGRPTAMTKSMPEADPGFTFAAIHLVGVSESRVESCWVTAWPSDGISLQRGDGNSVKDCRVQDCRGNGLHPGGGLRDSTFAENIVRGNGGEGMFFCAGVRHVVASKNVFSRNKGNGIGGLGDNGDKYNVVSDNVCESNGGSGIWLFDGDSNTVSSNICVNNARCGILLNQTADTIVQGNRCLDDQKVKTQKHGVFEFGSCRSNLFANNLCRGNAQAGLVLEGKDSQSSGNVK